MTMINQENIEIYILDFYEGNLNEMEVAALMQFLSLYPWWKEVFESFEIITLDQLPDVQLSDSQKNHLKKSDNDFSERQVQALLIGDLEDTLTKQEREKLCFLLGNDRALQQERECYQKTILEPDFSIVYPRKQELKKGRVVKSLPKFYQYVAAAVFLLFALAVSMYKFDSFFKIPQQSAAIKKIPHSHRPDALEQDHKHPVKSAERSSIQKGSTGSEHTLSAPSIFPSKGVSIPSSADNASETNHAPIDLNASENLAVDYVIALPHRLPVFSGIDLLQYPVKQPGVLQNQMVSDATLSPMVMETGNYSDRIARKINDLAGREIVQPGNMKLDYRGAFLALSQLLQGRSLILSHTVKESSEEVAIKLGNLEIGQSFSK